MQQTKKLEHEEPVSHKGCTVEMVERKKCNPDECRFNHVLEESNLRNRPRSKREKPAEKPICYADLTGTCSRGSNCFFSHNITNEQRNNQEFIKKIDEERKGKQALCVNEYHEQGSCRKLNSCRFNHHITDEQRSNPVMQERMKKCLMKVRDGRDRERQVVDHETVDENERSIISILHKNLTKDIEKVIMRAVKEMTNSSSNRF